MAAFCTTNMSTNLQTAVDAVLSTCDSCCFLLPTIPKTVGVSNYFTSTSSLPDIYTCGIPEGQIAFVAGDVNVPVISSKCCWLGLDGRLLRSDFPTGEIWAWGGSVIGDGTTLERSSPVSVIGGITDWTCLGSMTGQSAHIIALKNNGSAWAWGSGTSGQLGDNSTIGKSSPVSVVGGFIDWCQVSAGGNHTLALRSTGSLWAWGFNNVGQIGDNTITCRSSPVSVVGGFTDWCYIAAGNSESAAIRTNGAVWAWGNNAAGQLGDGTTVSKRSPVSVIGGISDWCKIAAGNCVFAAIRTDGELWAWGNNSAGTLGDNSTVNRSSPVSVVGGFTDWCQISLGNSNITALRSNGTIWTWGDARCGVLGDNTTICRSSPVSVIGGFTDWCQIATGKNFNLAIRTNGTIWGWGYNSVGQIGVGYTNVGISSPVSVIGGFTDWSQVSAGNSISAALRKY